jgi:YEATS domain-containing protein 4
MMSNTNPNNDDNTINSASPQPVKAKRVKGVTIVKPIVYGSMAWSLGAKAEVIKSKYCINQCFKEGKTHKWVCYVRGLKNEDISYYIKRVIFTLHPSFPNSKRGCLHDYSSS